MHEAMRGKNYSKKRFATYLQQHSKVHGVVKSKLYLRCCKGFPTMLLHLQHEHVW